MGQGAWDLERQTGLLAGKKSRFLDSGDDSLGESSHCARNDKLFLCLAVRGRGARATFSVGAKPRHVHPQALSG
jgi:hypothetical protein